MFVPFVIDMPSLTYVGGMFEGINGGSPTRVIPLTALTGGSSAAPSAGDIVVVTSGFSGFGNGNPGVVTAGYTEIADLYANDVLDANLSVAYKIMGSTPDTSITVQSTNDTDYGSAASIQVWRGVNQITPIDVASTTATGVNAARPNAPAIIPITPGAVIIACGLGTTNTTPVDFTAPAGMINHVVASGAGVKAGCCAATASYSTWTSGAYDPAAWTGGESVADDSWCAVTLVLRPEI